MLSDFIFTDGNTGIPSCTSPESMPSSFIYLFFLGTKWIIMCNVIQKQFSIHSNVQATFTSFLFPYL